MKLVNFFKMAVLAVAAVAVIGCEQQDPTETGGGTGGNTTVNENIEFTLSVTETLANTAKISVSHNGKSTDTWYGFVTTDTDSSDDELIKAEVKTLLAEGDGKISESVLKKAKGTSVVLSDLEESTDYRYVVTGLTSNGTAYGTPASVEFSTKSSVPDGYTQTDTWTITRNEERRFNAYDEEVEVFAVATDTDTLYYLTSYPAYLLDPVEENGYGYTDNDIVGDVIYNVQYFLNQGYPYDQVLGAGPLEWEEPRLASGDYVVYAVGFYQDGEPTYTYSRANVTIQEETADPAYEKWIGTWNMTSSSSSMPLGQGGTMEEIPSATYVVNIDHYDNNFMYIVTGWEMEGAEYDWYEKGGYTPEELPFPAYYTKGQLEFQEYDMFPFADSQTATSYTHYFGIYGYGDIFENGQKAGEGVLGFSGYGLPMALTSVDGENITLDGCTNEMNGYSIAYRAMGYMSMPLTENGAVSFWNYPMFFPITMEKVSDAGTASAAPMSVSQSKTFKFKKDLKDFKALKGLSLNEKKPMEPRQYKLVKKASLR